MMKITDYLEEKASKEPEATKEEDVDEQAFHPGLTYLLLLLLCHCCFIFLPA
jgi:hypothetical protein